MNRIKVNIITCFNANHKQKKCATDYRSKIGDTLLEVKPFQNPVMKRPLLLTGLGCAILVCGYGQTGPRINLGTTECKSEDYRGRALLVLSALPDLPAAGRLVPVSVGY